jgi:hypothetical protein
VGCQQVIEFGPVAVELTAQGMVVVRQIALEFCRAAQQTADFRAALPPAVAISSSFLISAPPTAPLAAACRG